MRSANLAEVVDFSCNSFQEGMLRNIRVIDLRYLSESIHAVGPYLLITWSSPAPENVIGLNSGGRSCGGKPCALNPKTETLDHVAFTALCASYQGKNILPPNGLCESLQLQFSRLTQPICLDCIPQNGTPKVKVGDGSGFLSGLRF